MKEKLNRFFFTTPINFLIGIPLIIEVIIWGIVIIVPDTTNNIGNLKMGLLALSFLFGSFAGITMIIRKEAPLFVGNEEKAVIQGYTLLIGNLGIAILIVIYLIFFSH